MAELNLESEKYMDFLSYDGATREYLEGTTAAGKTTVGVFKWMLKVAESDKQTHIIAAEKTGVIQKNIITASLGIKDLFGDLVIEKGNGSSVEKMPHLVFETPKGRKIIYLLGYNTVARWKDALGGQYGCVYIDEINTAHIDFVHEISARCDYLMATLNPDDPKNPVYEQYINRSRPVKKYERDVPKQIMQDLHKSKAEAKWTFWFFTFDDNPAITEKKRQDLLSTPKGTKMYKNKVQGLRGRAEGLIHPSFSKTNIISQSEAEKYTYIQFTAGVDTAYSQESDDTIAFIFAGITTLGEYVVLDEYVVNNRDKDEPLAPSDVSIKLVDFLEKNRHSYGFTRWVYVDSADQSTMTELRKLKKKERLSYNFVNSNKSVKIQDRINSMNGWMGSAEQVDDIHYKVVNTCTHHIDELETYSWKGDVPEDENDHTINASQYAWIPHQMKIGVETHETKETQRKRKLKALKGLI